VEGLRVAARTSSFALRNRELSVRAIADTLDVQSVLEGSVLVDGDRMRVIAQLIDARTGFHIWSAQYDGDRRDALALRDSVAFAIAGALHLQLAGNGTPAAQRVVSAEAYDLYLRGRYLWNQLTPGTNRAAVEHYARATELDPEYSLAWAGLADAFAGSPINADAPPLQVWPRARQAAAHAAASGPDIAESQCSRGIVSYFLDWDWATAEAAYRNAVALDPSYSTWSNYRNRYWPAKYLIDADGTVRHIKFGEGDYATTERLIRQLLSDGDGRALPAATERSDDTPTAPTTPETYFSVGKVVNYGGTGVYDEGTHTFDFPDRLAADSFALRGPWALDYQGITAQAPGSTIRLNYRARNVYLVVGGDGTVRITRVATGMRDQPHAKNCNMATPPGAQ